MGWDAVLDQETAEVNLCALGCRQGIRFGRRSAYLACCDLAESYDNSSIIRGQERLRSL